MNNDAALKQARAIAKNLGLKVVKLKGTMDGISWYAIVPRRTSSLPMPGCDRLSLGTAISKLREFKDLTFAG